MDNLNKKIIIKTENDPLCRIPEVTIRADGMSKLVEDIVRAVEQCAGGKGQALAAVRDDSVVFLEQEDIFRIYIEKRKLVICAVSGQYELRKPLRDVEDILEDSFVRISRFEIINLRKVREFDMSPVGTIKVHFKDGSETWVARRYVSEIKNKLKTGGGERNE